jgi:hypothetical protein
MIVGRPPLAVLYDLGNTAAGSQEAARSGYPTKTVFAVCPLLD